MGNSSQAPIYFNGRFLAQPQTGVQRYAGEVLKALDGLIECGQIVPEPRQLVILAPPEALIPLDLRHIAVKGVGSLKGNLWEQIELPWYARRGMLVSLCNIGPALHFNQRVTFHDASICAVPQAYSFSFRLKYISLYWILLRTARKSFTVSEFSRREIARYFHVPIERMVVIPEGFEHILRIPPDSSVLTRFGIGSKPYLLAVSSNSPHKNFQGLLKALPFIHENSFDLVIAGGNFSKVFKNGVERDAGERAESREIRVIRTGYISDGELAALYRGAACFVFPSFYEGFGLEPLEAMAFGCPVIAARSASIPEICGDAVLYCDPNSPEDIAGAILRVMQDEELRKDLGVKGLRRVQRYSWSQTAAQIWQHIQY